MNTFQVEGKGGFGKLVSKVRMGGPVVLFHGALAASGDPLQLICYMLLLRFLEKFKDARHACAKHQRWHCHAYRSLCWI